MLGCTVPVARGPVARLLGLALLPVGRAGPGLLIPGCRSVHTFGMRFDLDVHFLDAAGESRSVLRSVPPNRLVWDRGAVDVLEVPSGARKGGESASPSPDHLTADRIDAMPAPGASDTLRL